MKKSYTKLSCVTTRVPRLTLTCCMTFVRTKQRRMEKVWHGRAGQRSRLADPQSTVHSTSQKSKTRTRACVATDDRRAPVRNPGSWIAWLLKKNRNFCPALARFPCVSVTGCYGASTAGLASHTKAAHTLGIFPRP